MYLSYQTKDPIEMMLIDKVNSKAEAYYKAVEELINYRKENESS